MGIKLIGVSGVAGAGKDTVGNILVENHGFLRMAFGDYVKKTVAAAFGWPEHLLHDSAFKASTSDYWNISVRRALQLTGTEAIRGTFGADHWVKRWIMDYAMIKDKTSVVVTDVREEHEADAIRGLGGLIVHVDRRGAGLKGEEAKHSSEKMIGVDDRDLILLNNGTIDELQRYVNDIVQYIEIKSVTHPHLNLRNYTEQA